MTMSSFLMNSTPYAEPKFPPSEEYSQNNYMQSQTSEDYYRNPIPNYGYSAEQRRYAQESGYNNSSSGGGNSYGCVTSVTSMTTSLDSVTVDNSTPQSHNYRTPPPPAHSTHSDSPTSVPSPTPSNPSSGGGGVAPPGCTPNNTNSATSNTVIYPWMKRVHVGSQGKNVFYMISWQCFDSVSSPVMVIIHI